MNEFNEVLLVKQLRCSVLQETLEIPAGCLDVEGESAEDCMIREIKEETNLKVSKSDLEKVVTYIPNIGISNSKLHLYFLRVKKDQVKTLTIEGDDSVKSVLWMHYKDLEKAINEEKIMDSKTVISIFTLN